MTEGKEDLRHPVILFDGYCNLCSNAVQFIIRRDRKKQFRFASLQGAFGRKILQQLPLLPEDRLNSFILLKDGNVYTQSTAALKVAGALTGFWPLWTVFLVLPSFIRNAGYRILATHRYAWFGKKTTCWVPRPEINNLFIS